MSKIRLSFCCCSKLNLILFAPKTIGFARILGCDQYKFVFRNVFFLRALEHLYSAVCSVCIGGRQRCFRLAGSLDHDDLMGKCIEDPQVSFKKWLSV